MFKKEVKTYEANKESLLKEHLGKYVLIKNDEILCINETEQGAIDCGFKTLGNVPFLVKQIKEIDIPANLVSNLS